MSQLLYFLKGSQDPLWYLKETDHPTILNERRRRLALTSPQERPLDRQVGGKHYKDMKIQPVEFILANDLGFCEGNIIKYTCRYKQKGGVEDLEKVIHYAQMLIDKVKENEVGK